MSLLQKDMLLESGVAARFYQNAAPKNKIARISRTVMGDIAKNTPYANLAALWMRHPYLQGLLRRAGVQEVFVGGEGSDLEKLRALCAVMPGLVSNAAKLQCHAELQLLFDTPLTLCEVHADEIWQKTAAHFAQGELTPRLMLQKCGVQALLVAAAPADDLADFTAALTGDGMRFSPVFCPDHLLLVGDKCFAAAVRALDGDITDLASLTAALSAALDRFAAHGCALAAHSVLPTAFCRPNEYHADLYFKKALAGEALTAQEQALLTAQLWRILCKEYTQRQMPLELRTGGAAVLEDMPSNACTFTDFAALDALFAYLQSYRVLPRIALYLATPTEAPEAARLAAQYPALAEGKPQMQLGIVTGSPSQTRDRLLALANVTPLAGTLGGVSDARLYTSPTDADLFCRMLCALLADLREQGELDVPDDRVYRLVTRVCGGNLSDFLQL